ncbi:hypothetical protein [Leifsonia sp. NPDC058248]|uniref:hypothetical protein n=1 Tax=Leifsonia sp. NPDC058248 TaxID=3346402 RepID=UPI0036DA3C00
MLDEVQWFLDQSVHPALIAQELGRTIASIQKAAKDYERPEIRKAFADAAQAERDRLAIQAHPRHINQANLTGKRAA